MEPIRVNFLHTTDIESTLLIEGLPGVGQVGKLVAEHLIHELGAEKIAEIHSIYFPPQVLLDGEGVSRLVSNELYRYGGDSPILFLVGDYQSTSGEGHYLLADEYLTIAEKLGVKRIYTLGGYGVGHLIDEPRVLGAINTPGLKEEVERAGAVFTREEPGGGIVGASGLLLGLGAFRGIEGICLMGETSGYLVDPKSAHSLITVLCRMTGIDVDTTTLQERAGEMEQLVERLRQMEERRNDEELNYIG
ncbi:MAG: proteasome assembly chaperone family protein [Methanomicrobiaceae archaeon]|nr:proteasome assembly chaperone family protein [Methanomicrobiaceae archaeon]